MLLIGIVAMFLGVFMGIMVAMPNPTPSVNSVKAASLAFDFAHFQTAVIRCAEEKKSETACVTNQDWKNYLPAYITPPAATVKWSYVNGGKGATIEGYFNQPAPQQAAADLSSESAPWVLTHSYSPYGVGQGQSNNALVSATMGQLYSCCYAKGKIYFKLTLNHF